LALALLPAAPPATADPIDDVQEVVDAIDETLQRACEVDLCIPPWDTTVLDPILCPIFVAADALVPDTFELTVTEQGDLFVRGEVVWDCPPYDPEREGPDPIGTVQEILDLVDALRDQFCSVDLCIPPDNPFGYCPILAGLTPGIPPVIDVDPEGDVEVLGHQVHDCPPYGSR